ncbi:hypothetical protein [Arsukibacterium ikkense]|uniref:hypothetical protein n=1 Tax=Arsukibacterium ikkense TaxID=336831 RepID=UPI00128D6F3B|nr:hypothetical protein [Arsukibacterium ikkense]
MPLSLKTMLDKNSALDPEDKLSKGDFTSEAKKFAKSVSVLTMALYQATILRAFSIRFNSATILLSKAFVASILVLAIAAVTVKLSSKSSFLII